VKLKIEESKRESWGVGKEGERKRRATKNEDRGIFIFPEMVQL
jgi:hypothetical protein